MMEKEMRKKYFFIYNYNFVKYKEQKLDKGILRISITSYFKYGFHC